MASTRNKNTRNNYALELNRSIHTTENRLLTESSIHDKTVLPGNGVGIAQMPRESLSTNPVDIESHLFGIGLSDLTKPVIKFDANLSTLPTRHIYIRPDMMKAEQFTPSVTERPLRK